MFEGWLKLYKVDRRLEDYEREARLDPKVAVELPPIDRGLLKINSTFIEYVDRPFFVRGWAAMWGLLFLAGLLAFAYLFGVEAFRPLQDGSPRSQGHVYFGLTVVALCLLGSVFVFKKALLRDFFAYTHYPVRFNRHNRTIYVFRGNGAESHIALPWDRAFFFIASSSPVGGTASDVNLDLRCYVLSEDGSTVQHTFSAGNFSGNRAQVLQHWEMIRRYMEDGIDDLLFPPLIFMSRRNRLCEMPSRLMSGEWGTGCCGSWYCL
ncbi:DUF6708 domain-containing protein [Lysobacter sp. Root690]|uniref:DUF6708 domain-containing protein n=1 Tax=Lysobacter sp. Root690 TaxID=1736588 RepID=UPI0006FB0628|nr:DUF6708 domain-containing protein [Lysobacter sp. Root690]KRB04216.1 hypothetical protein ASD86_17960 [Lysobacter sp. Root690]